MKTITRWAKRQAFGGPLRKYFQLGALVTLLPVLAVAQANSIRQEGGKWIQEMNGSLAVAHNVRVKLDIGSVQLVGASQSTITYSVLNHSYSGSEDKARQEFSSYKITSYVKGDTAWIVGEWSGSGNTHNFSSDFVIHVPRETAEAKIETRGGNITAKDFAGKIDAVSGGGNVSLDKITGPAHAQTGGGNINIGDVGADLDLGTGGGSIHIVSARGQIHAMTGGGNIIVLSGMQGAVLQTGGGNISVKQCDGMVKASTGGGSIDLGTLGGAADVNTGGGSIQLTSARGLVQAESGSGSIRLNGVPSARAETGAGPIVARLVSSSNLPQDSTLETAGGDITVYLAPEIHLTVQAAVEIAGGHTIHSDFSEIYVTNQGAQWGPKIVTAEGSLNGGGPRLKLRTTTGNISILRADN
jgi:DUF4097 and DUF4098 domain-containing protein YvlB